MGRLFNNFSNRTWYIIAGVIVGLVILFIILKPEEKDGDLSLKSYDGMTTITIEEVVREEADNNGRHLSRCKVDRSKDFYRTFVKKNEYFIGTIDANGRFRAAEDNRDTGYYILLKDDHYFCLVNENGYAIISELMASVKVDGLNCYMPFPCDVTFDYNQENELDFVSLTGVDSFETLVEYYQRLKDDYYLVDMINKTITVHLITEGEMSATTMVISMTENGVLITAENPS